MEKYEIEDLINSNSDIKKAYEIFRENYRRYEIIDIYAVIMIVIIINAHLNIMKKEIKSLTLNLKAY